MKDLITGIRQNPDLALWYLAWLLLIILQGLTLR